MNQYFPLPPKDSVYNNNSVYNNYDLSISRYREIEYEEVKYEKPEVIKQNILDLERQIIEKLEEIDVT